MVILSMYIVEDVRELCRRMAVIGRGLSEFEMASLLGVTGLTLRRDWSKARVWLRRELAE